MDPRVTELHCIMPMVNIGSVMGRGILSYDHATKLQHHSVALQPVQDKRDQKQVPGGLKLHQYANLYFHARNPMMFKRKEETQNLCILQISTQVFRLNGTVISDQNAASNYVRRPSGSCWISKTSMRWIGAIRMIQSPIGVTAPGNVPRS